MCAPFRLRLDTTSVLYYLHAHKRTGGREEAELSTLLYLLTNIPGRALKGKVGQRTM